MKIKKSLNYHLIIFFLMVESYFFSLKIVGNSIYYINSNQQGILGVIVIILILFACSFKQLVQSNLIFGNIIGFFLLLYILEFVYSTLKYGQGAVNVFIASNYYLIILFYFCLVYHFRVYGINSFNECVVNISLINMFFHLAQYITYKRGLVFLFFDEENLRMGNLRLSHATCPISILGVIIAITDLLANKNCKKTKNIFVIVLGIISFVYVSRGRASMIGFAVTCIAILCYKNRKNAIKIIGISFLIFILCYSFLQFTTIGRSYLNSMSEEDTMSFRFIEMEYYLKQVKDNIILGVGFIRRMGFTWATQIITGPRYHYSRTDVGIVGFINTFGVLGLVWYIIYQLKLFINIVKISKDDNSQFSLLIYGIYIWNIIYMPTQILFGVFSICIQAVLMAYIDYYNYISTNNIIE